MTLGRDLTLLAFDERKEVLRHGAELDCALAGAELVSLIRERRVDLRGERVIVLDATPTGDHLLDGSLATMTSSPEPPRILASTQQRGFGLRSRYLGDLLDNGVIAEERFRRVGLLPGRRLRITSKGWFEDVRDRLQAVAADPGGGSDDHAFAALVLVASLGGVVFPGPKGKEARGGLAEAGTRFIGGQAARQSGPSLGARARAERAAVRAAYDAVQRLPRPRSGGAGMDADTRNAVNLSISLRDGL